MRRVPALLLVASLVSTPAVSAEAAHVSPRLRIASPEDGARVTGGTVRVVIVGEGGDGAGLFSLALDGTPVDTTGTVGGTFTTLSVRANGQTVLNVRVTPGEHELRLTQAPDPDNSGAQQAPIVLRFTVEKGGGGAMVLVLAALVVAGAVGAVVAVRRRAATEGGSARA